MPEFVTRFLSLILLVTSVGVMLVLILLGYQVALMLMKAGMTAGTNSMIVVAGFPSLFALGSLPFWLALRRLARRKHTE